MGCATLVNGLPTCVGSGGNALSSSNGGRAKNSNTNALAVDSSSAIGGTYAFNYATTGAGAIGDGWVSSLYTIDPEDQAKWLNFSIAYKIASGTPVMAGTSSNTYAVVAYDPVNNAFLGTTGAFNFVQSTGVGYATGGFQTASNTTSVQLFIYSPVAPTGTSSLLFDDVYVGRQYQVSGPAMTDWASFTPSVTNYGTTPTVAAFYRRVGADLQGNIYIVVTNTGGSLGAQSIGTFLPGGLSVNTAALPQGNSNQLIVGTAQYINSSTGVAYIGEVLFNTSSGLIVYGGNSQEQWTSSTSSGVPVNTSTSSTFEIHFEVPITGWSSNTSMSSDTDTRVVALDANNSGASLNYNAGTPNSTVPTSAGQIVYNTITQDTHGAYNSTTGVYTVPVTGWYALSASYLASATTTHLSDYFIIQIYNSTTSSVLKASLTVYDGASTNGKIASVSVPSVYLTAGTTLYVRGLNSGSSTPVYDSGATYNYFNVSRVSGPAVVAATESVNARYHGTSTSISGTTSVAFTTRDRDSHLGYSGSTYTFFISGMYHVDTCISVSGTYALNTNNDMWLAGSGSLASTVSETQAYAGGVITALPTCISDTFPAQAGDTIIVKMATTATGSPAFVSSNSKNYFSVARVGN